MKQNRKRILLLTLVLLFIAGLWLVFLGSRRFDASRWKASDLQEWTLIPQTRLLMARDVVRHNRFHGQSEKSVKEALGEPDSIAEKGLYSPESPKTLWYEIGESLSGIDMDPLYLVFYLTNEGTVRSASIELG